MTTLIQPPPPSYRKWWWVPAALLVVALVVAAVIVLPRLFREDIACEGGAVRDESGQCVRISDGSVSFGTEIDDLVQLIGDENTDVVEEGEQWVSIVLLTPMMAGDNEDGFVTMAGIRHRLAGAHLAQLAANETSATPRIRLLLANPNSDFSSWEAVVEEIQNRRADERIVAVTGISFSLEGALNTIERLTGPPPEKKPIGVIASTLTIDDLPTTRGFLKVSPPAEEHARAAADYLADRDERIMIVRDDNEIDHYGRTLADAFEAQFPDDSRFAGRPQPYNAQFGHVANAFRTIMHSVCNQKPSTIYFAGRGADALEFLNELAQRECRDLPIQVITADDMPYHQLSESLAGKALEGANITVRYTGHVHPDAWHENPDGFDLYAIDQFSPGCVGEICYSQFSDGGVHDFAAVMEYDAVKTAVQAIRNASGPHHTPVDSDAVLQAMLQLHSAVAFDGASGKLDFDDNGLPIDKPILILEAQNGAPPVYLESR